MGEAAAKPREASAPGRRRLDATKNLLSNLLERTTCADYAIFWTCDEDRQLLVFESYFSPDGQLMERSRLSTFATSGQGAVGRCWASKADFLVRDASASDIIRFTRVQLACYHGVHSVGLWRFPNGVLELGSVSPMLWTCLPDIEALFAPGALRTSGYSSGSASFDSDSNLGALPSFNFETDAELCARVLASGSAYGIFWQHFASMKELKAKHWFAPDGKCMKRSCTFAFREGEGAVGRAWDTHKPVLIRDAQELEIGKFLRHPLAVLALIRSIVFQPFAQGVLELGVTTIWEEIPKYSLGDASLAAATRARSVASAAPPESAQPGRAALSSVTTGDGAPASMPSAATQPEQQADHVSVSKASSSASSAAGSAELWGDMPATGSTVPLTTATEMSAAAEQVLVSRETAAASAR